MPRLSSKKRDKATSWEDFFCDRDPWWKEKRQYRGVITSVGFGIGQTLGHTHRSRCLDASCVDGTQCMLVWLHSTILLLSQISRQKASTTSLLQAPGRENGVGPLQKIQRPNTTVLTNVQSITGKDYNTAQESTIQAKQHRQRLSHRKQCGQARWKLQ